MSYPPQLKAGGSRRRVATNEKAERLPDLIVDAIYE